MTVSRTVSSIVLISTIRSNDSCWILYSAEAQLEKVNDVSDGPVQSHVFDGYSKQLNVYCRIYLEKANHGSGLGVTSSRLIFVH